MANRDLSTFRTVVNQVAKNSDRTLEMAADVGLKVIEDSQRAKINDLMTQANMDLQALNMNYRTQYESDPFGGIDKYRSDRKKILDGYGKEISPFFKKQWNDEAFSLFQKDDISNQAWGLKQSKINTVNSINRSIKSNMNLAIQDGMRFGQSDDATIESIGNFMQSSASLVKFAGDSLGEETAKEMFDSYNSDYMKSFLSGVAESNPVKALQMLDSDEVKTAFDDPKQYLTMKNAIENKALNIGKINAEKEVLGIMSNENNLLTKSLTSKVPYSDLMVELEKGGYSESAKDFFLKANGYTKPSDVKLTDSEKLKEKARIYKQLSKITGGEIPWYDFISTPKNITSEELNSFQGNVYTAMNRGSLSTIEGAGLISQVLDPFVKQKANLLDGDTDFSPDLGLGGVNKIINDDILIPVPEFEKPTIEQKEIIASVENENNENRVMFYDMYMERVSDLVQKEGKQIADIQNMSKVGKKKLFEEALRLSREDYLKTKYPALNTLKDVPNQIFSNGKLIQGAAGNRNIKPDFSVKNNFELFNASNGYIYRKYEDGSFEEAGKWK